MSTKENKAIVRRVYKEGWNEGNMEVFDESFSADFVYHDPGAVTVRNLAVLKEWITELHTNWSPFHLTIEDVFGEGDRVAVRGRGEAIGREGEAWGIPVSGKSIAWTFNSIYRLANGKIAENWNNFDAFGILQQLGGFTPPRE